MKASEGAHIAFVMLGIWFLIQGLLTLLGITALFAYPDWSDQNTTLLSIVNILSAALLLIFGLYFLLRGRKLAQFYFPDSQEKGTRISIENLETLTFGAIGLFIFLQSIPRLANIIVIIRWFQTHRPETADVTVPREIGSSAATILQAILGVLLFIYAGKIATLWRRLTGRSSKKKEMTTGVKEPVVLTRTCPHCGQLFSIIDYRPDAKEKKCSNCEGLLPEDLFKENVETTNEHQSTDVDK